LTRLLVVLPNNIIIIVIYFKEHDEERFECEVDNAIIDELLIEAVAHFEVDAHKLRVAFSNLEESILCIV
jgi:hypothetical protein